MILDFLIYMEHVTLIQIDFKYLFKHFITIKKKNVSLPRLLSNTEAFSNSYKGLEVP